MRKKIICFILTLTIVMLTACGNTDAELKYQFIQEYDYYKKISDNLICENMYLYKEK